MNRYVKALIPALSVAAGTYFYITAIPDKKRPDYYSGTFNIKPAGDAAKGESVRIVQVIEQRLKNGNYPAKTRKLPDGTSELRVEKITDTVQIKDLFTKRGQLQIRPAYTQTDLFGNLQKAKEILLAESNSAKQKQKSDTTVSPIQSLVSEMETNETQPADYYNPVDPLLSFFEQHESIYPYIGKLGPRDTARLRSLLSRTEVRTSSMTNSEYYFGDAGFIKSDIEKQPSIYLYAIERNTSLMGSLIDNSDLTGAKMDIDYMNRPVVAISFTGYGAKKWSAMTGNNIYKPIAILIDGTIISAPIVEQKMDGSSSVIAANFTVAQAKALADLLSSPPLPVQVQLLSAKLQKAPKILSTKEILTILGTFLLAFGLGLFVIKTFEQNK